jgi:type 2 lantibiotic biosynthesis protein LanM
MAADSTRDVILALLARSATFEERVAGELVETEPCPADELAAICAAVGLAPKDLELRGPVAAMLARARPRVGAALPGWAVALEMLLAEAWPGGADEIDLDAIDVDEGGAFARGFAGFIHHAGTWLDAAVTASSVVVAPAARRGLLTWLCRSLTSLARFVLYDELRESGHASPREYACAHLASRSTWLALLRTYPVLGRLLGDAFDLWQRACGRLLAHVATDWQDLGEYGAVELRDVAALALKHPPGKCPPLRVTLPSGRRVVYQDKNLQITAWVAALIRELDGAGLAPPLEPPRIVARTDHAWTEFVEPRPCDDPAQAARYFQRIGMYLRLFQALRTTDMHARNVVAVGEHPVFIDLETVLQPARRDRGPSPVELAVADRHERSPLDSSLLPLWVIGEPGRRGVSIGGLHRGGFVVFPVREAALVDAETRDARYTQDYPRVEVTPTLPAIAGQVVSMIEHLPHILDGYRSASAVLATSERVQALVRDAGDQRASVLWRSGFLHERFFHQSLGPLLLTDGRLRDAFLTRMMVGFTGEPARTLARAELAAVRDAAAPMFESRPASSSVWLPDGREIADVFAAPALDRIELGRAPADEARDLDVIASAIGLEAEANGDTPPVFAHSTAAPVTAASPLDTAIAIADLVLGEAITAGDESMWIGATWCPTAGIRRIVSLPMDLLSGNAGLAVVFAYLYRRCEAPRFRDAATRALAPVIRTLRATLLSVPRHPTGRTFACGAYIGVGAQLYALRRCAALLDDTRLAERAREVLASIPPALVSACSPPDVIMGAAGLVLVAANVFEGRPANVESIAASLRAPAGLTLYPADGRGRAGLPNDAEGVAWALARWSGAPADLDNASLLTRLACGSEAAIAAARTGEPRGTTSELLVALAARDASGDDAFTDRAQRIAAAIAARHRETGRWLDDPYVADRLHLSAVTGLGALALALARIDAPALRCCARLVY